MRPKALILSLHPDVRELEELLWSLGYDVGGVVVQRRDRPDPATYLGSGKLDEAADAALRSGVDLVAVNASLKPSQVFSLERHFRRAQQRSERARRIARQERKRGGRDADVDPGAGNEGDADGFLSAFDVGADDAALVAGQPGGRDTRAEGGGATAAAPEVAAPAGDGRDRTRGAAAPSGGAREETRPRGAREDARPGGPIQVFDRVRVILEIFSERARSPEARLQVEYARLQYETPLVKEVIHLAKKGEHPGFLGGGRYEVNYYYMMMRSRMARIRRELERISRERDVRRRHRRRGGMRLVSLAGYTNAGKSSLLEALAGADTVVENRYFSTLATTTRRASRDGASFLLTDTVGFIEDLPPWMVEAFHSTLEEIALADCILLTIDASEPVPEVERKIRSSLRVLAQVHARLRGEAASAAGRGRVARYALARPSGAAGGGQDSATREADDVTPETDGAAREADGVTRGANGAAREADGVTRAANGAARGADGVVRGPEGVALEADAPDARADHAPGEALQQGARQWAVDGSGVGDELAPGGDAGNEAVRGWLAAIDAPLVVVLNKVDVLPPQEARLRRELLRGAGLLPRDTPCLLASARTGEGLGDVFAAVDAVLPGRTRVRFVLPEGGATEAFLGWLWKQGPVQLARAGEVTAEISLDDRLLDEARSRARAVGGRESDDERV